MRVTQMVHRPKVLVSDFDGTMTAVDFYRLTIDRLLPAGAETHWTDYRTGKKTHFQALAAIYTGIRASEATVLEMLQEMHLEPRLPELLQQLNAANWDLVIVSAGCGWYIDRLLSQVGVSVPVFTNPGRFVEGLGLLMREPIESPYHHPETGIDKAAVVRDLVEAGKTVAFAGDGYPDTPAARLVPPSLRFAKDALAESLQASSEGWIAFSRWAEVVEYLLKNT